MVYVASRLEVSMASRVRGPPAWLAFVVVPAVLLVAVVVFPPLPLLLVLVEDDLAPGGEDDRHMSAHVCSALMALAAAARQGLAGLEHLRRLGASAALLGWVLILLPMGGMPPPCACPASGPEGGVIAAVASAPKPPASHGSQASMSEREGGPESVKNSDNDEAVTPSPNSDSSLPPGDVPALPDGLR
ncbi:uncharacterized protein B0H64DRAFT_393390 [Chaetomium fimeti]|uniref:Uncharacterized protein n=1 Tax=Chaetomium fimeti TaxID=1854472 RepID=A0AAE0LU64_9PEZI|nr:hypothetical protein B0H64DRAFT_393390 [Chaetomium fimeti]